MGAGGARASVAWEPLTEPYPSWTQMPLARTARYNVRRGRQDEFTRITTGTADCEFTDLGALGLDPTLGGDMPLHGMLELYNPVTGEWSSIFRGHVEEDTHDLDGSMLVLRSTLQLVDAFDYLAGYELAAGAAGHPLPAYVDAGNVYYGPDNTGQAVDDRIYAVLVDASWSTALSSIYSGNVTVQECIYDSGTQALTVIYDAADAEFPGAAIVYISKDGEFRFRGRFARFNPGAYGIPTWQASTGDHAGAQLRPPLTMTRSRAVGKLVNAAMATVKGTTDDEFAGALVTDTASIDKYGVRSWSADELLTQYGQYTGVYYNDEARLFSQYYVDNLKNPVTRIDQLTFRSVPLEHPKAADTWALICGVEIGDVVEVTTDHPSGAGLAAEPFYVEGVNYTVSPLNGDFANVTLTLDVSPASLYYVNPFS